VHHLEAEGDESLHGAQDALAKLVLVFLANAQNYRGREELVKLPLDLL